MRANKEQSIREILRHEGGYVNHPRDPGGCTNKGITIGTYRAHINPKGTCEDIRRLTLNQAVAVYGAEYWDRVQGDHLPAGVDLSVFDFGVNAGPSRAAKMLQRIVGVAQDGRIGPLTLAAVWDAPAGWLIERYAESRLVYYRSLRTFTAFGRGWTRRTLETEKLALSMWAAEAPSEPGPAEPKPADAADVTPQPSDPLFDPFIELRVTLNTMLPAVHSVDLRGTNQEPAARALQRAVGAKDDGIIGPQTWQAIASHLTELARDYAEPDPAEFAGLAESGPVPARTVVAHVPRAFAEGGGHD